MGFWSRMLSGIADTILPKDLEEDALLLQMEEALREEKELWRARQNFLEPGVARSFQNKWRSAYYSAKKKSTGMCEGAGLGFAIQNGPWKNRAKRLLPMRKRKEVQILLH